VGTGGIHTRDRNRELFRKCAPFSRVDPFFLPLSLSLSLSLPVCSSVCFSTFIHLVSPIARIGIAFTAKRVQISALPHANADANARIREETRDAERER